MAPETDTSPRAWLGAADGARREAGLLRSLTARSAVVCEVDLASNDYLGLARHPAVVGYAWSRWRDGAGEQPPFAGGLVHLNDAEAREHTELLADVNARVQTLRHSATPLSTP